MLSDDELLSLYRGLGTIDLVAEHLRDNEKGRGYSARSIRRKLKAKFPSYSRDDSTGGAEAVLEHSRKDKEDMRPIAGGILSSPDKRRRKLEGRKFVLTCAQNNTYVHEAFLDGLKRYCEHNAAQLIVSTFTYNKSGFQNGTKEDDALWYDPELEPYILNESVELANGLIFCGELDILPTAVTPLSGFENYTQSSSGIIPHTKMQMQSLPRMKGEDARFLYTTGTVTQRNYIQRKAGQKAEFHHVFGALVVEVDAQGDWFVRQLIANEEGVFHDLTTRYSHDGIQEDQRVLAITWGDIHMEKLDPQVFVKCFGDKPSMLTELNPSYQFIHDLTDFRARNHHNLRDPFFLAEMHHRGSGNVEQDLLRCGTFLNYITRYGNTAVIVESNHDQALTRWLKEADIRQDPENAEFFHRASMMMHKAIIENVDFNVFEWAVTNAGKIPADAIFLSEDDSFVIGGIEQGMHGHRGPNGARGNPRGFRSIGRKVNIGHMHSAGIFDGVYVAGVSGKLDMDYNKGPSSWSHSHILTYANGKRTIVTMKDGKWRA